jgi:hypothetical protein
MFTVDIGGGNGYPECGGWLEAAEKALNVIISFGLYDWFVISRTITVYVRPGEGREA